MDTDSEESASGHDDGHSSSNDEKALSKKPKRAVVPKSNKGPKAPRSLDDIRAGYKANQKLESSRPNSPRRSTRNSPAGTTQSVSSQDVISAPRLGDAWEDVVKLFQEAFQDYRDAVIERDEKDADAFGIVENSLKDVGMTVLKRGRHDGSNDEVRAKCKQFLQYVTSYCQHHNQAEMHSFFENLLSQQNEGTLFFIEIVFQLILFQVKIFMEKARKHKAKWEKAEMSMTTQSRVRI